jgi:hypothetical protein
VTNARAQLVASAARELAAPISADAAEIARAIQQRHGAAVAAVAFYGSCLRRATSEGVLDFYAVVDDYRAAYRSRTLAVANALLPPNVFYLEMDGARARLRAKYAVVSRGDFARACRGESRRASIWARFAQPVAVAYARDAAARDELAERCADAICTAVRTALALRGSEWQPVDAAELWRALFRASYAAELRTERTGAGDAIYAEQAARFDARLAEAIAALEQSGALERAPGPPERVRLRESNAGARVRSPFRVLAMLTLAKSAFTFGDWVPYALWKLERHSGLHLEASERQRRHPFLFGWPLLLRAWRSGALH